MKTIWTHKSAIATREKPWTALRINEGENPYETLAQFGDKSGAGYGKTELEAITDLLAKEQ